MRFFFTSLLFLSFVIMTFSALAIPANAQTFSANLSLGSRGPDVISLQQILVAKGFLQMPSGTAYGYFGPLTKAAVARWQAANNITPAVGYFGPISRAAIASQTGSAAVSSVIPTNSTPPVPTPVPTEVLPNVEVDTPAALGMRAGKAILFRVSPFEVRQGGLITLDGSGFSKTINKVYFNNSNAVTATSSDGVTMKLSIPSALSEGEYKLSVSNVLGSTNDPEIDIFVKVTNNPQPEPVIESASVAGDILTLVGTGFTSANNLVTTLGDSPRSVSSNGNILTFRITELSMYNEIRKFTLGNYQTALWIYVQNEHGVNKEPYKLEITI